MKDERKTKAQLIEELQTERQKTAAGDAPLRTQLAVERVRAAAMDMRSTADLQQVVHVLVAETQDAGIDTPLMSVFFVDESAGIVVQHTSTGKLEDGKIYDAPDSGTPYPIEEWLAGETAAKIHNLASAHYRIVSTSGHPYTFEAAAKTGGSWSITNVPFQGGMIGYREREHHPEHDEIIAELARGLEFGFQRFRDFRLVEQQNRELTVQNALEQVRARVAGMQQSQELTCVLQQIRDSLVSLDFGMLWTGINIFDLEQRLLHITFAVGESVKCTLPLDVALEQITPFRDYMDHWERQEVFLHSYGLEEGRTYLENIASISTFDAVYQASSGVSVADVVPQMQAAGGLTEIDLQFTQGSLYVCRFGTDTFSAEDIALLERFAEVLVLGYRRHLDLTAAEERAALSARETAYERVRGAVLAARNSDDIVAAASLMEKELRDLGVRAAGVGINVIDEDAAEWRQFAGREVSFGLDEPGIAEVVAHQRRGETYIRTGPIWPESAISREEGIRQAVRAIVDVPFTYGTLAMNSKEADAFAPEEIGILEGFADVISLAYTRFQDFQKLEAESERVRVERAAERIRSEAMAMTSTQDLLHVSGLLAHELRDLGIQTQGCMIHFLDEEQQILHKHVAYADLDERGISYDAERVQRLAIGSYVSSHADPIQDTPSPERRSYFDKLKSRGTLIQQMSDKQVEDIWQEGSDLSDFGIDSDVRNHKLLGDDYGMVLVRAYWGRGMIATRSADITLEDAPRIEAALADFSDALALGFTRFMDFQRLEQASRNKSQFLRRMSHDLRSPMNAIIGYSRLLRRRTADRLDEREQRNLRNIETSSGNLLNLINDILDLSRIEAGRIELNLQPVDVVQLAHECADALGSIVKEGVILQKNLAAVGQIQTDPERLRQVLMNLLGNATKFTETGSITLSLRRHGNAVETIVADTGVGIPPADLPHIFDEFRQVERQGGEQTEGTGLGLAIAKKTVDLLGGEIIATSIVGVGTTFSVRLNGADC